MQIWYGQGRQIDPDERDKIIANSREDEEILENLEQDVKEHFSYVESTPHVIENCVMSVCLF